jgi:hypothetical protein
VGSVDHLHAGGHRRLDKRNVVGRFREAVRSKPDPGHFDVTDLHANSMLAGQ